MAERRDEPSPLEIERWLLDELDASERARVEAVLGAERAARLAAEDEALRGKLLQKLPPAWLAERVRARLAPPPMRHARRVQGFAVALAGTAIALSFWLRPADGTRESGAPAAPSSERAKGLEPELRVYRKRASGAERLGEGALASAGDVLQLGYLRAGRAFGVVLSIDGRGDVTRHFPREGGSTALGDAGGERLLPEAYELDDAPAFERFVFVASARPLDVEAVLAAARRVALDPTRREREPLALGAEATQRSLVLRKAASP